MHRRLMQHSVLCENFGVSEKIPGSISLGEWIQSCQCCFLQGNTDFAHWDFLYVCV